MLHDVGYRISSSSDLSTSAITDICSGGHRITLQRRGNIFLGPRGPLLLPSVGWYVRPPMGKNFFSPSYPPSLPSLPVIPVIPGIGKKFFKRWSRKSIESLFGPPATLEGEGKLKNLCFATWIEKKKYPTVIFSVEDALSDNPKQYFSEHSQ